MAEVLKALRPEGASAAISGLTRTAKAIYSVLLWQALERPMLILSDSHGLGWTLAGLVANLVVVALVFIFSRAISRALGDGGMTALSKIVGLFLAAIAVMMMRVGIQGAFALNP